MAGILAPAALLIYLEHALTKCFSAQQVSTERYLYLGDTEPVNLSTETSRFTWEGIPLWGKR